MILDKSFTKEWIQEQRIANKGGDPGLIEKQIYAFELLHRLLTGGKEFVFKGGTSLHLILPEHRRLSTDLDIVGAFDLAELSRLISHSRFLRVEENIRKKSNIPKRHFKFYYSSVIDGGETYVLLDTLEENHTYPKLEKRSIASRLFETDEEVTVHTPSLESPFTLTFLMDTDHDILNVLLQLELRSRCYFDITQCIPYLSRRHSNLICVVFPCANSAKAICLHKVFSDGFS